MVACGTWDRILAAYSASEPPRCGVLAGAVAVGPLSGNRSLWKDGQRDVMA